MTILQAIVLGIVQGLTEFIPVSSSAHLVLVPWLLGWTAEDFSAGLQVAIGFDTQTAFVFGVLVQWGTLVAVFAYFWSDVWLIARAVLGGLARGQPFGSFEARLGWWVVLATIPAVVFGLLLKDQVEATFSAPVAAASFLFVTAAILLAAERLGKRLRDLRQIGTGDALIIGFAQVLALFPGVSRSGATIGAGMLRHLDRPAAARFSFLMSIPALLGAGVVALVDLFENAALLSSLALPLLAGFLAAAVTGYLSVRWLLGYLQRRSLIVFAVYCVIFGAFCLVVALARS